MCRRMQLGDQLGVVQALVLRHGLRNHLPDGVAFGHVGADVVKLPAIFGDVGLDHISVAGVVALGIPTVGHHDALGVAAPPIASRELAALVGASRGDQHLRIEVLLLEALDEGGDVGQHRANDDRLGLGCDELVGDRVEVGRLSRVDLVRGRLDAALRAGPAPGQPAVG